VLAGDSRTSSRLFAAISLLSIPVIVSDDMQLPYADQVGGCVCVCVCVCVCRR
jgi:hypothetical protein